MTDNEITYSVAEEVTAEMDNMYLNFDVGVAHLPNERTALLVDVQQLFI